MQTRANRPEPAIRRHGRAIAVGGAVIAISATTLMTLAVTASAAETGTCTDNVNVRAQPTMESRIVALCQAGKKVQVGKQKNGFVELPDYDGWASAQYVAVGGRAPAAAPRSSAPEPDATPSPSAKPKPKPSAASKSEPADAPHGNGGNRSRPAPTTAPAPEAHHSEGHDADQTTDSGDDEPAAYKDDNADAPTPAPRRGLLF